jgi:hypothetical protein
MKSQEIEIWVRDLWEIIKKGINIEDSKVEMKSNWVSAESAAPRLAGHANAARGENILWIIGIDEKNKKLTEIDPVEKSNWLSSLQKWFDGFAPLLEKNVNIIIEDKSVVALYFNTSSGSPFVVKNKDSGYPQYIVPWRECTGVRAAKRDELLKILIPNQRLSSLLDELEYNLEISQSVKGIGFTAIGAPFRVEEFERALRDKAISTLPDELKKLIVGTYIKFSKANARVNAALSTSITGSHRADIQNEAQNTVLSIINEIKETYEELLKYLSQ